MTSKSKLESEICSVCLCPFDCDEDICLTKCGHSFHNLCLFNWHNSPQTTTQRNDSCPVCRAPLRELPFDILFIDVGGERCPVHMKRAMQIADLLPSSEKRVIGREFVDWLSMYPLKIMRKSDLRVEGTAYTLNGISSNGWDVTIALLVDDLDWGDGHLAESLLVCGPGLPTIHVPRRFGEEATSPKRRTASTLSLATDLAPYLKGAMWLFCNEPHVIGNFRRTGYSLTVPPARLM